MSEQARWDALADTVHGDIMLEYARQVEQAAATNDAGDDD